MNRKLMKTTIGAIAVLTLLIGGSVNAKTVITVGVITGPKSVNPFVDLTGTYWAMYPMIYDRLMGAGKDGKIANNIATDIERSIDGLTYTVKVRNDAVFHDGKPVTVEDIVFSYNYIMENKLGTLAQYTDAVKEVKRIDDATIAIKLKKRYNPEWFADQTLTSIPILPKRIWSKISKEEAVGALSLDKLIGSGPFTISEFEADHFTRLTITEDGKKRYNTAVDEVIVKQYANDSAMLQDFKVGNLVLIETVPANMVAMMEKMENVALNPTPTRYYSEVIFNSFPKAYQEGRKKHPHPALKDPQLRYALDWVLDENIATRIVHGKYSKPGSHMLPTGYGEYCNTNLDVRGFDIEKAKKILTDAGYKDANNDGILEDSNGLPLKFDVWLPAPSHHEVDYAGIWAREAKKIGVKLDISVMDFDTLWGKVSPHGNFDIAFWDWSGGTDPDFLLSVLTSGQAVKDGWSDSGYSNPTYDTLYEQQKLADTFDERRRQIWKMQEILYKDAPYLVYSYYGPIGALNTAKATGDLSQAKTRAGVLTKNFILSLKPVK